MSTFTDRVFARPARAAVFVLGIAVLALGSCSDTGLRQSDEGALTLSRSDYASRLHGFWLGQSIGNWTGLITEMDKIGGDGPHGEFYTRADWGQPDQPAIWGEGQPSEISPVIDFVLRRPGDA